MFAPEFDPEFVMLAEPVKMELLARLAVLREFGPRLGRPNVGTLKGSRYVNMKELRFSADNGVWRVAFAFDTARRAILLVAGNKAGSAQTTFYRNLIEKADRRFAAHLEDGVVKDKPRNVLPARGRSLDEMMKTLTSTQREAVERRATELITEELSLSELRKALNLTQAGVAKRLKKGQDRVSRIEHHGDILLSTLQDYLDSLGGELELVCRFKDRAAVRLKISPPAANRVSGRRPRQDN